MFTCQMSNSTDLCSDHHEKEKNTYQAVKSIPAPCMVWLKNDQRNL